MNCLTCSYAIFDAQWGLYKCSKKTRDVHPELDDPCSDYHKGTPRESLANEEYYEKIEEC